MAFIEQIEKQELKLAIKNIWLYVATLLFMVPIFFSPANYNLSILILLSFVFALIFIIDIKEYIIPDASQITLFLLANSLIYFSPEHSFIENYIGFVFAGLIFGGIYFTAEKILKKEILGFGDVKLFANIGLLVGFFAFNYFLWILTILSGSFIIFRKLFTKKSGLFPFGPFIVVAAWICLLFQNYFDVIYYKLMNTTF